MNVSIRHSGLRGLLVREGPSGLVAVLIAEQFYRLGSFTLELLAFASTWVMLSWAGKRLLDLLEKAKRE